MTRFFALIIVIAAVTVGSPLVAQTDTVFTYQGELNENGGVANGVFNLDFTLWGALAGGNQIGSELMFNAQPVVDGRFTVELDFGASAFDNSSRWLEVTVNGTELSPRQPVTRAPYSIQTRGIVVDENNNVGIGTSTPTSSLHVMSSDSTSIYGHDTSTSGNTYGVSGTSESTSGRGVFGEASASTGITDGVFGLSNSTSGRGICGWAPATSGTTYGVFGTSDSFQGTGVFGEARSTSGTTFGGEFESASTSGRGVFGYASAGTGTTYGGQFVSQSSSGFGVLGDAPNNTGSNYGVYGRSGSTSGHGVYGLANASTGVAYGVYGRSSSASGHGVFGLANRTSGINYGGWFESNSTSGRGVFGFANANSGINYAVVGHSNSSNGYDFWASGAGTNYGSPSSRRFKSNIVPIADALGKLAKLQGVYFDWDDEHGGQHDVGMIAEEVGAVMPEIVQYEENGVDAIGMDYSKMTPLLVEAVNALRKEKNDQTDFEMNELRAENDAQRDEINALSKRLDALEQQDAERQQ